MIERLKRLFAECIPPGVEFCSLRAVFTQGEQLNVRRNVPQPLTLHEDAGAMVTVRTGAGIGYGATSELTAGGLRAAAQKALALAEMMGRCSLFDGAQPPLPSPSGEFRTEVGIPWESWSLAEKLELLQAESAAMRIDARIVDWGASLGHQRVETLYLTHEGGALWQGREVVAPGLYATAFAAGEAQQRSLHGGGLPRQAGLELLEQMEFRGRGRRVAEQALALLAAEQCPSGRRDLLLAPDQMMLQIHESIGHPLELDRILGDERNFAGTSFVTPEMFGSYRYGSELLNVSFDPAVPGELASYAYDDEGSRAEKRRLIERGVLRCPLGGLTSQRRAGLPGVANTRACNWNRPPIDRMANLNLEPGESRFEELIAQVERGIYMETNRSWSIDDSRNKFQFGCEWGRLIEEGRLTRVVKNPNYRGISESFWRSLAGVGGPETVEVHGTPNCGKGEPNQVIAVGHASPPCLFRNVEVFGG